MALNNTHNGSFNDRGTKDFELVFSDDGVNFFNPVSGTFSQSEWANEGTKTIPVSVTAQFVRMNALTPFVDNGANSTGLHEMQVFGTTAAAVPEPGTYALMGAGLALIGFTVRRWQVRLAD